MMMIHLHLWNLLGKQKLQSNVGLPRLNINYDVETEDGVRHLLVAHGRCLYDGEFIYAKEVLVRPILRTFEWSVYDMEQGKLLFVSLCKNQHYAGEFPDTLAGNKCGRLSAKRKKNFLVTMIHLK